MNVGEKKRRKGNALVTPLLPWNRGNRAKYHKNAVLGHDQFQGLLVLLDGLNQLQIIVRKVLHSLLLGLVNIGR